MSDARKGDVIVWRTEQSATYQGGTTTVSARYRLGVVVSATRAGVANTARELWGGPTYVLDEVAVGAPIENPYLPLMRGERWWVVSHLALDMERLRAELGSYPPPSWSTLDDAREAVRPFLQESEG